MQDTPDSLTVDGCARWSFSAGEAAPADRASRNIQIFRWLESIQAESVSGSGDVDAEIAAELRRLDAKLSMVLDLLLDRSGLGWRAGLSEAGRVYSLSAQGVAIEFDSDLSNALPAIGAVGMLEWYPEARWPSSLRFLAKVRSVSGSRADFEFLEISESERDSLERWIFREHRRARERHG